MVCQMVAVGESTGGLDGMLKKVAELYEEEVDDAVANLTAMMEPMIMVVLGVILGGLGHFDVSADLPDGIIGRWMILRRNDDRKH